MNLLSSLLKFTANQISRLDGRVDDVVSAATVDSEVIDIRNGLDGTHYTSAGAAVRGQYAQIQQRITSLNNSRVLDISNLRAHKVAQPLDENNQPTDGTDGQSLRTKGDGTTEWADVGLPTDAQTAQAVSAWLDEHPEATTTVLDESLSSKKLIKGTLGYVTPEMYGAKGDGIADDTIAIQNAINIGKKVVFSQIYLCGKVDLIDGTGIVGINGASIICSDFICFDGDNVSNISIQNIELYKANYVPEWDEGSVKALIHIQYGENININNCKIHDCYSGISVVLSKNVNITDNHVYNYFIYGLMLSQTYGFVVHANYIHDSLRTGGVTYCISATGSSIEPQTLKDNIISNNILVNNPSWSAIMSHGIVSIIVQGNQIDNVRSGVDFSASYLSKRIVIANNIIRGTDTDAWEGNAALNVGISLPSDGQDTMLENEIIITGNYVENFGIHNSGANISGEIYVNSACDLIISNNILNHSATDKAHSHPINLYSACKNVSIVGNVIKSLGLSCAEIRNFSCDKIIFANNVLQSDKTFGILALENTTVSEAFLIKDNVCNVDAFIAKRGTNTVGGVDLLHVEREKWFSITHNASVTVNAGSSANITIQDSRFKTSEVYDVFIKETSMRNIIADVIAVYNNDSIVVRLYNNYDSAKTFTPTLIFHSVLAI